MFCQATLNLLSLFLFILDHTFNMGEFWLSIILSSSSSIVSVLYLLNLSLLKSLTLNCLLKTLPIKTIRIKTDVGMTGFPINIGELFYLNNSICNQQSRLIFCFRKLPFYQLVFTLEGISAKQIGATYLFLIVDLAICKFQSKLNKFTIDRVFSENRVNQ